MLNPAVFAKRLKEERVKQGITQRQLAESAEITAATLSSYEATDEKKRKSPSLEKAAAIANRLGVSLDFLCGNIVDKQARDIPQEESSIVPLSRVLKELLEIRKLSTLTFEDSPNPYDDFDSVRYAVISISNQTIVGFLDAMEKIFTIYTQNIITQDMFDDWLAGNLEKYKDFKVNLTTGEVFLPNEVSGNYPSADDLPF